MPEARTQENRNLAISTPLGDDKLLLLSATGSEALGRLFQFQLELLSEKDPVKAGDILGKNVTIRLQTFSAEPRFFNGYVSRFTLVDVDKTDPQNKLYKYRATMVPWAWFLTRVSDCRIFQAMTVPKIIEKVFRDRNLTDFKFDLSGTYREWEYCVQYRETDFNFVSRLMENEGIYYYFKHDNGKHTMMLCDSPQNHCPAEKYDALHFDLPDLKKENDDFIWNWTQGQEITPNAYCITDYDPLQPTAQMGNAITLSHAHDPGAYEVFDFPGGFVKPDEGKNYVNTRIEEIEAQYSICQGTSSARGIYAGCTFKLEEHPAYDDPPEFLITAVNFQLNNDDMGIGKSPIGKAGDKSEDPAYLCQVTCIPKEYEFRSPRTTPKPAVQGPQTAVVVVMDGQEITTDEHGRVKVKFHWDRTECMDEKASCWVRVSQSAAGKGWGAISIPRKGQEVIVDFLEGDPDRPIITGRVYNGVNVPPYELPGNATMTAFKSNSSKGGEGFNEIRIEDKKNEEQMFIHAQKNMDIRVLNDRFETICHDRHLVVDNDKFEHVKNKRNELVDVDHSEEIKGDRNLTVGGKEAKEVVKSMSLKVTEGVTEEFLDCHSEVVTKDYYLKADNICIEALTSLTIKVGKNHIAIDMSGIKIGCEESAATFDLVTRGDTTMQSDMNTAMESKINFDVKCDAACSIKGTGQLNLGTDGMGELKAIGMLGVKSTAMLTVEGTMVKIN